MPKVTELARGGAGIHAKVHRTLKAAQVPLGSQPGVGTEGDQREGQEAEEEHRDPGPGRLGSVFKACRAAAQKEDRRNLAWLRTWGQTSWWKFPPSPFSPDK